MTASAGCHHLIISEWADSGIGHTSHLFSLCAQVFPHFTYQWYSVILMEVLEIRPRRQKELRLRNSSVPIRLILWLPVPVEDAVWFSQSECEEKLRSATTVVMKKRACRLLLRLKNSGPITRWACIPLLK